MNRADAEEVRRRLADPRQLVEALGFQEGARPQSGGLLIRCPFHADRSPSGSVRVAEDGTIAFRCFGCGATGDVFHLVAVAHQLDARRDFPRVLALAGQLAGSEPLRERQAPPVPRAFPPVDEVEALWRDGRPVTGDPQVALWLISRGLGVAAVRRMDLARALPVGVRVPRWAFMRSVGAWPEAGYRCVLPLFDESGRMRSVRARRVVVRDTDGPKALPPGGCRTAGLVMASPVAREMLAGAAQPDEVLIFEGEPDFLLGASAEPAMAVLGVIAGAWSSAVAARIPDGARVSVRTHHDLAGDKYAATIADTLRRRCPLFRGRPPEPRKRDATGERRAA